LVISTIAGVEKTSELEDDIRRQTTSNPAVFSSIAIPVEAIDPEPREGECRALTWKST
jgi:hypothetical protein